MDVRCFPRWVMVPAQPSVDAMNANTPLGALRWRYGGYRSDLPWRIGSRATRVLKRAGVQVLGDLSGWSLVRLRELHGVGTSVAYHLLCAAGLVGIITPPWDTDLPDCPCGCGRRVTHQDGRPNRYASSMCLSRIPGRKPKTSSHYHNRNLEIMRRRNAGETCARIGREFGVSRQRVSEIALRESRRA